MAFSALTYALKGFKHTIIGPSCVCICCKEKIAFMEWRYVKKHVNICPGCVDEWEIRKGRLMDITRFKPNMP